MSIRFTCNNYRGTKTSRVSNIITLPRWTNNKRCRIFWAMLLLLLQSLWQRIIRRRRRYVSANNDQLPSNIEADFLEPWDPVASPPKPVSAITTTAWNKTLSSLYSSAASSTSPFFGALISNCTFNMNFTNNPTPSPPSCPSKKEQKSLFIRRQWRWSLI